MCPVLVLVVRFERAVGAELEPLLEAFLAELTRQDLSLGMKWAKGSKKSSVIMAATRRVVADRLEQLPAVEGLPLVFARLSTVFSGTAAAASSEEAALPGDE